MRHSLLRMCVGVASLLVIVGVAGSGSSQVVAQGVAPGTGIPNGEWCGLPVKNNDNCASKTCYPSPGNGDWGICAAKTKNCAWPGTDGGMFKETRTWRGRKVECMNPGSGSTARFAYK
jgi:hypothetical protein